MEGVPFGRNSLPDSKSQSATSRVGPAPGGFLSTSLQEHLVGSVESRDTLQAAWCVSGLMEAWNL